VVVVKLKITVIIRQEHTECCWFRNRNSIWPVKY